MLNFFYGEIYKKISDHHYLLKGDYGFLIVYIVNQNNIKSINHKEWFLYVHTIIDLKHMLKTTIYAFNSYDELNFFQQLLTIDGIGIITALKIAQITKEKVIQILKHNIACNNYKDEYGISKLQWSKLRVYFLDDKNTQKDDHTLQEIIKLLKQLGYKVSVINSILNKYWPIWKQLNKEEIIRMFIKEAAYAMG